MISEQGKSGESVSAQIGAGLHEGLTVKGRWQAAYYAGGWTAEEIDQGLAGAPVEVYEADNLLVNVGIQLMLDLLIGAGGTVYDNSNAYIGIGDSNTAAAAGQTDLQAVTNKVKAAMDATFPSRSGQTMSWRCTFGASEGNFSIQEAALFNDGPNFTTELGTMLNRLVSSLGTKTSATTLQVTLTLTIS
jgi:hypothetical protein